MFTQEFYYKTYNIRAFNVVDGLPPIYQLKKLTGSSLLTTSPFLTDTEFPKMDGRMQSRYVNGCIELCKKLKSDYLLVKTRLPALAEALSSRFEITERFITTVLDISEGEDFVWKNVISDKVRNHIRKGYKFDPEIKWGRSELLQDFFHVFATTQTQLGTPVHSLRYFSNIIQYHPNTRFTVLILSDAPVSAALTLAVDGKLYAINGGTINKYKPTSINSVLYWERIKYGINNKCSLFDMGRSFRDSGNARFKRSWGGEEIQLYYCYYLNRKKTIPNYNSKTMKLLTTAWKNLMPVYLAKKIGPIFIKSVS